MGLIICLSPLMWGESESKSFDEDRCGVVQAVAQVNDVLGVVFTGGWVVVLGRISSSSSSPIRHGKLGDGLHRGEVLVVEDCSPCSSFANFWAFLLAAAISMVNFAVLADWDAFVAC